MNVNHEIVAITTVLMMMMGITIATNVGDQRVIDHRSG